MLKKIILGIVSLAGVVAISVAVGCGDTTTMNNGGDDLGTTMKPDLTSSGPQADMTPVDDCVKNPVTSVELLNACTDTQHAPDKTPAFPTLAPNGVLPADITN